MIEKLLWLAGSLVFIRLGCFIVDHLEDRAIQREIRKHTPLACGILAAAIVLGFSGVVHAADELVVMYYYNVFEKKPLPVGTSVWVNIGDTECAWTEKGIPSASDGCFHEYLKAKIVEIHSNVWEGMDYNNLEKPRFVRERYWMYRVEIFFPPSPDGDKTPVTWNAGLDDAYTIYNLPEKWASYSRYFIRLNW